MSLGNCAKARRPAELGDEAAEKHTSSQERQRLRCFFSSCRDKALQGSSSALQPKLQAGKAGRPKEGTDEPPRKGQAAG